MSNFKTNIWIPSFLRTQNSYCLEPGAAAPLGWNCALGSPPPPTLWVCTRSASCLWPSGLCSFLSQQAPM